jgi:putative MATE family efflux protein
MSEPPARHDLLRGPIGPALTRVAWPVIAGEAIHVAFHLVDIAWVRPLGAWATAAIMTSMFTLWTAFALCSLVGTGLTAHAARAHGAGDPSRAGRALAQAIWLAALLAVPVTAAGVWGAGPLFSLLTDDPLVRRAGAEYLGTFALGMPFLFLSAALQASLRAAGNTRLPLLVSGLALLANMGLAPLLIYGWGPFPQWGVRGSAVATVTCMAAATLGLLALAWRGHPDMPLSREALRRPRFRGMLELARVGAPHAAIGALFSVVYLGYARIAGMQGAAALAVLGVGNRLESVTYLTADGFGVASASFVGQNLGAGDPRRAERGAWQAAGLMAGIGAVVMGVMLLVPEALLRPFTSDPAALALGVGYVRALALCQVFTAVEGALGGAFAGAGDTVPPMIIHVSFAVVRIPLALLAQDALGGLMAVAWTMTATCVVRGALMALWFRRGAWKRRELRGFEADPLPSPEAPDVT